MTQGTVPTEANPFRDAFRTILKDGERSLKYYLARRVVNPLGFDGTDVDNSVGPGTGFFLALYALDKAGRDNFSQNLQEVSGNPDQIEALYHLNEIFSDLVHVRLLACKLYGTLHGMGIKIDDSILSSDDFRAWGSLCSSESTKSDDRVEYLRDFQASLNTLSILFQRAAIQPKGVDQSVRITTAFLLEKLFGIKSPLDFNQLIEQAAAGASTDIQKKEVEAAKACEPNKNLFFRDRSDPKFQPPIPV